MNCATPLCGHPLGAHGDPVHAGSGLCILCGCRRYVEPAPQPPADATSDHGRVTKCDAGVKVCEPGCERFGKPRKSTKLAPTPYDRHRWELPTGEADMCARPWCGSSRRCHPACLNADDIEHQFQPTYVPPHSRAEPSPAGPPVAGDGDEKVVQEIIARHGRGMSVVSEAFASVVGSEAYAAGIARGRALGARDASFNNDWFCSTECMGYTRDDIDKGFCVYCAAPVARDGERKP